MTEDKNSKIYQFNITSYGKNYIEHKYLDIQNAYLKNGDKILPRTIGIGTRVRTEDILAKKEDIDCIEVSQTSEYKSVYTDFSRYDNGTMYISKPALNFLKQHNIQFWQLQKPIKIVNDDNFTGEYYLIKFTEENDVVDIDASGIYWDDKSGSYEQEGSSYIKNDIIFNQKALEINGIFKVKHLGYYLCDTKTKELLEKSGLTGFEFIEQKVTPEKPKSFLGKLLGR